jgi:hypothetical protein
MTKARDLADLATDATSVATEAYVATAVDSSADSVQSIVSQQIYS